MFKLSAIALVALVASLVSGQTIQTPTTGLFTCDPYLITFSGGQAPYTIRANQGGSVSQVLETIASGVTATSYTWNVNLGAGQSVTLALTDATGNTVYADAVTVQAGSSTSCVGQSASGSSAASSSAGSTLPVSSASSTAAAGASSVSSAASSAVSGASSTAAGALSSIRSQASSALGGAASAASSAAGAAPTSGAATLAISGGLAAVGGLVALLA
ncbi:hypothetical protein JCM16303_000964 [Sporobolomyces ruberrimus]